MYDIYESWKRQNRAESWIKTREKNLRAGASAIDFTQFRGQIVKWAIWQMSFLLLLT